MWLDIDIDIEQSTQIYIYILGYPRGVRPVSGLGFTLNPRLRVRVRVNTRLTPKGLRIRVNPKAFRG